MEGHDGFEVTMIGKGRGSVVFQGAMEGFVEGEAIEDAPDRFLHRDD